MGGYINFTIQKQALVKEVLNEIEKKKESYGIQRLGEGKTVIVEYSSPNIAKPFHIGHPNQLTQSRQPCKANLNWTVPQINTLLLLPCTEQHVLNSTAYNSLY